jgi:hypothetical protein
MCRAQEFRAHLAGERSGGTVDFQHAEALAAQSFGWAQPRLARTGGAAVAVRGRGRLHARGACSEHCRTTLPWELSFVTDGASASFFVTCGIAVTLN